MRSVRSNHAYSAPSPMAHRDRARWTKVRSADFAHAGPSSCNHSPTTALFWHLGVLPHISVANQPDVTRRQSREISEASTRGHAQTVEQLDGVSSCPASVPLYSETSSGIPLAPRTADRRAGSPGSAGGEH